MEVALVALKRGEPKISLVETSSDGNGYVSEDEHLQNLEKSGQMQQVIGSQSMLSQEIHHLEAPESPPPTHQQQYEQPESQQDRDVFSQDLGGAFSQVSVNATGDFDSQQLAHQYGLLSQDPAARVVRTTSSSSSNQHQQDNNDNDNNNSAFDSQGSRSSSQGGFGTLLEAVSIFQSQEEEEEKKGKEEQGMRHDEKASSPTRRSSGISTRSSSKRTTGGGSAATTKRPSGNSGNASKENSGTKRPKKPPTLPLTKNNNGNNIQGNTNNTTANETKVNTVNTTIPIACGGDNIIISSTSTNNNPNPKSIPSKNDKNNVSKPTDTAATDPATATNRKRKRKDDSEQIKQQKLAHRAADLAQRTINDPELAKRLLLSMALTRENPRSAPETLPGPGHVLPEGFFWAHYPPLEKVLKDNMAEYYELSITKCQSAQQQSFNNTLVELVRAESNRQGWLYAPCFTDKNLRDRIRCYYKTHIQNAKKRLRTMVKNPTKRANARHLCAHLDMIEKNVEKNAPPPPPAVVDPAQGVITHQDWGSAFAGNIQDAAEAIVAAGDRAASFEARVEASVAAATKAAKMAASKGQPDMPGSGVPIAATNPMAASLAPDAVLQPDAPVSLPPELAEASSLRVGVAVNVDPIAPVATDAAITVPVSSDVPDPTAQVPTERTPIPPGIASPAQPPIGLLAERAPPTSPAPAPAFAVSSPPSGSSSSSPVAVSHTLEITSPVMMI